MGDQGGDYRLKGSRGAGEVGRGSGIKEGRVVVVENEKYSLRRKTLVY